MKVDAMVLEKGMHFHPGLKAQHLANGGFRQQLCTVALKGQCLKDDPRRVLAHGMTCCASSSGIFRVISTGVEGWHACGHLWLTPLSPLDILSDEHPMPD